MNRPDYQLKPNRNLARLQNIRKAAGYLRSPAPRTWFERIATGGAPSQ